MDIRPLSHKDFNLILQLDKKVYPTDSPVTEEIISRWYSNNPEFGAIFGEHGKTVGVLIAIPLNKPGWKKLIEGNLNESELNEKYLFDNSRDRELGIHIYHIEKLRDLKNFYKPSLEYLSSIINKLRLKNKKLKVVGLSALATSVAGINLFSNVLEFKEGNFICPEHILKKNNSLSVFNAPSEKELKKKLSEGYELVTRCKMLVLSHKDKSIVCDFIKFSSES